MTAKRPDAVTMDEIKTAFRICRGGHEATDDNAILALWNNLGAKRQAEYLARAAKIIGRTSASRNTVKL